MTSPACAAVRGVASAVALRFAAPEGLRRPEPPIGDDDVPFLEDDEDDFDESEIEGLPDEGDED